MIFENHVKHVETDTKRLKHANLADTHLQTGHKQVQPCTSALSAFISTFYCYMGFFKVFLIRYSVYL